MSGNLYPNLGFNPVPGVPDDVESLREKINSAGAAVKDTNDILNRLRNNTDDVWKGAAGDAFRNHFDASLAQDLGYAQHSLERAVTVLNEWHTDLIGNRDAAQRLETEAAAANQKHDQAVATLQQAQANPDLNLAHETFSDLAQLQAAQTRLNTAVSQVNTASSAVTDAQNTINWIIKRAHDLEHEHDKTARKVAAELDAAAKDFAMGPPHKHWWDSITDALKGIGDWISKHKKALHDILSTVAAIGALVALVTPPPFDIIGMAVGVAASAANVGLDLNDPKVRGDIGDFVKGIPDGKFNTKDLGSLTTLGLDTLGTVPGVSSIKAVSSMGKMAEEAAQAGKEAPTLTHVLSDVAHSPSAATKAINLTLKKVPDAAFGVGARAKPELALMNRLDTIELGWRGKTVGTAGYHDVKDWLNS